MSQLYPLNPSEVIFAPWHDEYLSRDISYSVVAGDAQGFRTEIQWDSFLIKWEYCPDQSFVGAIETDVSLNNNNDLSFDNFIFCFNAPPEVNLRFYVIKACDDSKIHLGGFCPGGFTRQEILCPVPKDQFKKVGVEIWSVTSQSKTMSLRWFGLRNESLHKAVHAQKVTWNPQWPGLIRPSEDWNDLTFRHNILIDQSVIAELKSRKHLDGWIGHYQQLENAAIRALKKVPEDQLKISDFTPFSDERYTREHERGRSAYYYDALTLAIVGMVNYDKEMIHHALRFLMCMLHLKHWSPSEETRLQGSSWDQRCFTEEMMTTSVALLLDWLDGAITDRARELGYSMLWDKGLSVIERDMAKFDYLHHNNQGPWFSRARILGGLLLEKEWPHFKKAYVDEAYNDLRNDLERYINSDGGIDEGPMYMLLTLETTLVAFTAYSRSRNLLLQDLILKSYGEVPNYLAAISSSKLGTFLPLGDCGSIHQNSDATLILAKLFPGSLYESLAGNAFLRSREFSYSQHYVGTGIFSFLLGPEEVREAKPLPAGCRRMSETGIVSFSRNQEESSFRIVIIGSKPHPSHSHFDKGSFVFEKDTVPVFIDRGQLRYDNPYTVEMRKSENHNVLCPSFDGITTMEQNVPDIPVIPECTMLGAAFKAEIDLSPVWRHAMLGYTRKFESQCMNSWVVCDFGELINEGQVVFYLQSHFEFQRRELGWICGNVEISCPWAESSDQEQHLYDCEDRPVYRLQIWSPRLRKFNLSTSFRVFSLKTASAEEKKATKEGLKLTNDLAYA